MNTANPTAAQRIAQAMVAFQHEQTGHTSRSVVVVLRDDMMVVTLNAVLSPTELALGQTPEGTDGVQTLDCRPFKTATDSVREVIRRITGVEVQETAAEAEPATGTVVKVFTSGIAVQAFLPAAASTPTPCNFDPGLALSPGPDE
jgi:uncharacterized protein YbcI